jgi:hypothetical protein
MDRIESWRSYRPEMLPEGEHSGTSGIRRPNFDVGEALPALKKGELEIVRISLASVTGDVISVRIKKSKHKFAITIVDEYETYFFDFIREHDQLPTQGEIFELIATMRHDGGDEPYLISLIKGSSDMDTVEAIMDFIRFDSLIYPNLNELFRNYLHENGFSELNGNADRGTMEDKLSSGIKRNLPLNDWSSLIGTLCFNIWSKTNRDFIGSNDLNDMKVPFLCALNLFQQWDRIYLSEKFDVSQISSSADQYVRSEKDFFYTQLSIFENAVRERKVEFDIEASKLFISLFTAGLIQSYSSQFEVLNPLDFFQKGIEILLLLAMDFSKSSNVFSRSLLDIGEYESTVEQIIREINSLEEFEK